MANNPYVNKVQKADGTTIIDISDTTATASEILQGYGAYGADGAWMDGTASGGSSGIVYITDEEDEHGGIVRHLATDGATITDTVDEHGGTVRSITGTEVYLQSRNVTPTEAEQTITPTGDYNALGLVKVGAIPSDYIGSAIEERDSSDLTVSGATVNVPAGVYASAASKTITSGSATTPTTSITANPSISVSSSGLITATASASQNITPTVSAGYVSSGTAGTVSVSGSNTSQLTTQAAATITPSTSQQTAVAAGRYTTGAVTVAAMPTGTEGTPTATKGTVSNHSVTVTPSVTNTAGYIAGGTKTGTGVSVSASELVSGTLEITENGTYDISGYQYVNISVIPPRTANITSNGRYDTRSELHCNVRYPYGGTVYYTAGDSFSFEAGTTLYINIVLYNSGPITITAMGETLVSTTAAYASYNYTLPDNDIDIALSWANSAGSVIITKH